MLFSTPRASLCASNWRIHLLKLTSLSHLNFFMLGIFGIFTNVYKKNHGRSYIHVALVPPCLCKGSENIIKNCIYEQITSPSSYTYLHQRDWQELMTYRYKTEIRLTLNTGDREGHMYDKAHAQQQQQQWRVTQTLHRTTYSY